MGTEGSPIMGRPIQGSSAVIGPDGRILTAANTTNEELVIADLDMEQVVKAKTFADASGHCNMIFVRCGDLQLTLAQIADQTCCGWALIRAKRPSCVLLLLLRNEQVNLYSGVCLWLMLTILRSHNSS